MHKGDFDIRNYMPEDVKSKKSLQRDFDRFNLYMNLIDDIPLRILLTTKVSELFRVLEKNLRDQQTKGLKSKNISAVLKAGREFVKASGDRTIAEIFATRKIQARKLDLAIKRIRKLGIFIPPLQQSEDLREQYFRKLIVSRVVNIIGHYRPRDLFEKSKRDASELEKGVIIEAKMVGLLASSSCGDPPPPPNNLACGTAGGIERCNSPLLGSNCVMTAIGCSVIADPSPTPTYEPIPGGSDNP